MFTFGDVRYAFRLLARSPIFSITAVVSLALGIAASTTIFSLIDALLIKPGPGIRNAAEVVDIGRSNEGDGFDNMSYGVFKYLKAHSQTLAGISAVEFGGGPMSLEHDGTSERVHSTLVSASYFDVLGTRAALGRFFFPDDDAVPGERAVVVLTHAFWMQRLGGDPTVLDRPLRLNNRDFTVVGVAEPGFEGLTFVGTDVWVPVSMVAPVRGRPNADILDNAGGSWIMAVGRLKPEVGPEQAQAELNTLIEAFKAEEPRVNKRHQIAVSATGRIPPPVRLPFMGFIGLLFAMTTALLAIACSNVAGMLLARAADRRREMATRLAVGAGRWRLIGQLLTETLVLFVVAGLAALPLTVWLINGLESFLPALPVAINLDLSVSPRVAAFALGASLVTAVLFGLAPARLAVGGDLAPSLHGAYATADRRRLRGRNILVVAQVALSLTLAITASLFMRTLQNVAHTDPGYRFAGVALAGIDVSISGYQGQQAVALIDRFHERLAGISGVTSVSFANQVPLQGSSLGLGRLKAPGYQNARGTDDVDADWNVVTPRYFETVGTRVVAGRDFTAADRGHAARVAIVNETFARVAWPGRQAVGQRLMHEVDPDKYEPVEVVGVVADAKYRYYSDRGLPFIFVPLAQFPMGSGSLFVKAAGGRDVAREIRAAMAQVEPGVPVIVLQSFEEAASIGLIPQRVAAWTAGGVGAVGIFLAALGLYGLMAFVVTERRREMAIRMALGASSGAMQRMVVRQAGWLAAAGGAVGVMLAGVIGTLVETLLVGVPAIDPVAFGGTGLLFAVVLMGACWMPARRAAATDPATALRAE